MILITRYTNDKPTKHLFWLIVNLGTQKGEEVNIGPFLKCLKAHKNRPTRKSSKFIIIIYNRGFFLIGLFSSPSNASLSPSGRETSTDKKRDGSTLLGEKPWAE